MTGKGGTLDAWLSAGNQRRPSTRCPMCRSPASLLEINRHLDRGCGVIKPSATGSLPEVAQVGVIADPDGFHRNGPVGKGTVSGRPTDTAVRGGDEDFVSSDDDILEAALLDAADPLEDGRRPKIRPQVPSGAASPPDLASAKKVVVRASPSITNRPKRFGGVKGLVEAAAGDVTFSPSPKKARRTFSPRGGFFRKSPALTKSPPDGNKAAAVAAGGDEVLQEGVRRNLQFGLQSEPVVSHVPFTQSRRKDPDHVPYYLVNFETVLRAVMDETDDAELFGDDEKDLVRKFRADLDLDHRKLYVRLFQRKHTWIPLSAIKYDEIEDPRPVLDGLLGAGFVEDGDQLDDLEALLPLLGAPDLKRVCKEVGLAPKGGGQKRDYISALVSHANRKQQPSCFFTKSSGNSIKASILKKVRPLLGSYFRIQDKPRMVFCRILSLYTLTNWWDDRENQGGGQGGGQQGPPQLTTVLLKNTGRVTFPEYRIIRNAKIFRHRDDLLLFEEACSLESLMAEHLSGKDWPEAVAVGERALGMFFDRALADEDIRTHVLGLPQFLRRFTCGSVLAYVLTKLVEALEKSRGYGRAVEVLRKLLAQDVYLRSYRGLWHERLALDLDQHLKRPEEALQASRDGIEDLWVRDSRKVALCQRVAKICASKRFRSLAAAKDKDSKDMICDLDGWKKSLVGWVEPSEPQEVVLQGRQMPKANQPGAKSVFVFRKASAGLDDEEEYLCSVEEFVRETYKSQGFSHGSHSEGSLLASVCFVLFWDVIFDADVPDAFRSPHQPSPLDLHFEDFYLNRKAIVDKRLQEILVWEDADLLAHLTDRWARSGHVNASLVNWDLLQDPDHVMTLLRCFSNAQLHGICRKFMTNYRYSRSGFPDLTMWNPESRTVAFVEVKGPGDRLSTKQVLWLQFLAGLGLQACVCHVEAVNSKSLAKKDPSLTPKVSMKVKKVKKVKRPVKKFESQERLPDPKKVTTKAAPSNDDSDDFCDS